RSITEWFPPAPTPFRTAATPGAAPSTGSGSGSGGVGASGDGDRPIRRSQSTLAEAPYRGAGAAAADVPRFAAASPPDVLDDVEADDDVLLALPDALDEARLRSTLSPMSTPPRNRAPSSSTTRGAVRSPCTRAV